jgi:hypothetical protein
MSLMSDKQKWPIQYPPFIDKIAVGRLSLSIGVILKVLESLVLFRGGSSF